MNNRCFKYVFLFILSLIIFVPNKALANSEYTIDKYNINMIVNEDNTFDITEKITTYFNVDKHGIYRKIPFKNSITRTDGTKSKNSAKITNINVSENYTISNEIGYKVIKIGDANKTLTGRHTYTIKYTYDIGKDPLKDADELYFNLIGDEWDTSISNVTFKITMPKSFDKSLLGFSSGIAGSTNSSNVYYSVAGNVITGSLQSTLDSGEALTVRLSLPEGYFVGASSNIDVYSVVVIIISLICVLIAYELWSKYGKDEEVIETVEFYPPEEYNSAEIQFLYDGKANEKGVISLIVYLANKGYLKIEDTSINIDKVELSDEQREKANLKVYEIENRIKNEKLNNANPDKIKILENLLEVYKNIDKPVEYEMSKKEKFFSKLQSTKPKNKFIIRKIKDYDGENRIEKIFMDELFGPSKKYVTSSDLYYNFFRILDVIKSELNSKENKDKIFEPLTIEKRNWIILMIVIIFIMITLKPIMEFDRNLILIFALLFVGMGFDVMFEILIRKKTLTSKISGLIGGLFFGCYMALPALIQNTMYLTMYIVGIISIAFLILFAKIMPKRILYGNEILGKIKGFKRFLETAEKTELESLVYQNPEYFYNILPYTYALGVSDVWMNQFETIALQAPDWYDCHGPFDMHDFNHFMDHTMASTQTAMSPSSSSSSGGGSSGGGSGGGGGGSW